MKCSSRFFCLAWFVWTLVGTTLAAEPPSGGDASQQTRSARPAENKEQLARRLASVAMLIEKSSAARQIESSANPDSLALRDKARALLLQADQAYRAEDLPNASRLLNEAAKMMYEGARQAAPWQITDDKNRRDFDARMESVKALLAAQKRISFEKNAIKETEIGKKIESQIQQANTLADAKQLDQGRVVLDQAYAAATASLEGLRTGYTTTRTLNFANQEEEYRYELDRNDAHQVLVNTLLKEKRANNPSLESMVQKYLELAARLRSEAAGMAAKGDYTSAIRLQEDSTLELLRAIRSAGIYIPG